MQEEVAEVLDLKRDGVYVDATIGPGGHTAYLLERIGSEGKIIGIDRDEEALEASAKKFAGRGVCLKRGKFSDMAAFIRSEGITEVDGILFDLGISMLQLKNQTRGFSFLTDARLDMRMDSTQEVSAWDIVNTYPEKQLERILREYGEERFARKIAKGIVQARHKESIDSCAQLSEIVRAVYRKRGRIHPATRTFQALRVAVNKELEQLTEGLSAACRLLRKGGRLCVISYHSLEDRIVKHFIAGNAREKILMNITKKPRTPSAREIRMNPSARSAKLRAAEKI